MTLLPENPRMVQEAHGSGAKGMAFYSYEAQDLDVIQDVRRKDGRSPFVDAWRYRWLPERTFPTYAALREAVNALAPEAIEAERAKWPKLVKDATERMEGGTTTHCWLHKTAPATHMAWVQTSWHQYDGISAIICADCAEVAKIDAHVVIRASNQRRDDCAARATPTPPASPAGEIGGV